MAFHSNPSQKNGGPANHYVPSKEPEPRTGTHILPDIVLQMPFLLFLPLYLRISMGMSPHLNDKNTVSHYSLYAHSLRMTEKLALHVSSASYATLCKAFFFRASLSPYCLAHTAFSLENTLVLADVPHRLVNRGIILPWRSSRAAGTTSPALGCRHL